MKPVNVNAFDVIGEMAAAEIIAFGAAVQRSAAGTVRAPRCTADDYNILGIADLDLVEKDEEGYYSKYDIVPVIVAGRCRVWVTPNNATAQDIVAGDYLELADISTGTNTLPVGVFEEAGSQAGATRTLLSLARALEDVDLQNCEVVAAQANANGKITTSTNKGKWSGETGTDIYDDINTAIGLMDGDFEPAYLIGNRTDLLYLNRPDSERVPYYKSVAGLFGKKDENDKSWMWMTNHIDAGKVYLAPKDFMAAEFVVAENPHIIEYPMQPGQNYYFEVVAWVVPEFHQYDAFVEIATG